MTKYQFEIVRVIESTHWSTGAVAINAVATKRQRSRQRLHKLRNGAHPHYANDYDSTAQNQKEQP